VASTWASVSGPADLYAETGEAVLTVATNADTAAVVTTQGRRMTVESLLRTLAVEAAIHHLDLEPVLPEPPSQSVLKEVCRLLDALVGQSLSTGSDAVHYIRVGTGRSPVSAEERKELGALADRFPLFG